MPRQIDDVAAQNGMTSIQVADLLDKAADEMMIRGGTKGRLMRDNGTVCLYGAIAVALGTPDHILKGRWGTGHIGQHDALRLLRAYMAVEDITLAHGFHYTASGEPPQHIDGKKVVPDPMSYNDHCDTTEEQSIDLLRNAAKWIRGIDGQPD